MLALLLPAFGQIPTFEEGLVLYRDGRFSEAVEKFSALKKSGKNPPLLDFYQGVCLAKLGNLPGALKLLLTYVSVQSGDPHGWYWLSRVQLLLKQFPEAHTSIERAIDLDAKSSESFRTLGEVELELTNNDAAYRAWITANNLNPGDAQTTYHLGRLFFEAEFFDQAAAWLRETLRIDPSHFNAMTYLGLCAEHLGDNDAAISLYRKAIQQSKLQNAPSALAYLSYAKVLRQTGHSGEALSLLEEAETLCPEAYVLSFLGQLLAAERNTVRAEAVLRRAIQMNPQISEVHYRLSLLLRSKGNMEEAQKELMRFKETKEIEEHTRSNISAIQIPVKTGK